MREWRVKELVTEIFFGECLCEGELQRKKEKELGVEEGFIVVKSGGLGSPASVHLRDQRRRCN